MKKSFFDFGTIHPDLRPVTIRTRRAMLLRRHRAKDLMHVAEGTVLKITMDDFRRLSGEDYEISVRSK